MLCEKCAELIWSSMIAKLKLRGSNPKVIWFSSWRLEAFNFFIDVPFQNVTRTPRLDIRSIEDNILSKLKCILEVQIRISKNIIHTTNYLCRPKNCFIFSKSIFYLLEDLSRWIFLLKSSPSQTHLLALQLSSMKRGEDLKTCFTII